MTSPSVPAATVPGVVQEPELTLRAPRVGMWRRAGRLIRDNPLGFMGLIIVVGLALCAVFAAVIAPYPPDELQVGPQRIGPSMDHLFGTDKLGRDMFSRVVYGARISLFIGFASVLFGTIVGTAIGIFSGYTRGWVDSGIQRSVDTLNAFPPLLGLLILRQVLGASLWTLALAVGIAIIPGVTRVVRGAVLAEGNNQYVEAARAIGASTPRILFIHILPNVLAITIVIATSLIGVAILAEAALAFLGLGIPDAVTWGGDVDTARNQFPYHLWQAFFPGAAITLTVLAFNLLGDSLRDIFDPRLRGRL
jgi:ABC-type dipeptide/oligopeptide/nickel transport system permease subunit